MAIWPTDCGAAPVTLADVRFALPTLPAGTVTADFEVAYAALTAARAATDAGLPGSTTAALAASASLNDYAAAPGAR